MVVLKHGLNIYKPKLTMNNCIILENIYGSITKPIENMMPKLEDLVFIFSLSLDRYDLDEDTIYDLIDDVDDLFSLILRLYEESGLINQDEEQNATQSDNESVEPTIPQTFEGMCQDMIVQCMSIGLSRQEFYDLTLKEVTQYADSYKQRQQTELETMAFFSWQTANLVGLSVARLLSKDANYPSLDEAYPFVKDGIEATTDENGLTKDEQQLTAQMMNWAYAMQDKQKNHREIEKMEK